MPHVLEQIQYLPHLRCGNEDIRGHASQGFQSNFRDGAIPPDRIRSPLQVVQTTGSQGQMWGGTSSAPGQQLEQLVEVLALLLRSRTLSRV